MNRSVLILTDSGGIQEEGPSFGKPILILRTTTERPDAVTAGFAELVGTDPGLIVERATYFLEDSAVSQPFSLRPSPFDYGFAGKLIAQNLFAESPLPR